VTPWWLAAWLAATALWQPADGARLYRECQACHALEPGRNTPAGPTLFGIVGRPIASERDFNYSPAMRRFGASEGRWTAERLDRFLAQPEHVVAGTEMGFPGIPDPAERRRLIDWLGTNPGRAEGR
jgi:cytochrome c